MSQLRNPHPGEILKEEFLNEIGMSQNHLGHAIGGLEGADSPKRNGQRTPDSSF